MKNILSAIFILLITTAIGQAQNTATDFTATDCNGTSHNLFNELKTGKVVVLVWVMPCATCINDARGAYEAVKSHETTNPGKVLYYLIDDNGGTGCTTLKSWAENNGIRNDVIYFRNQGLAIDEDKYGGTGMPHVVVVGPDQNIYFNVRDGSDNQEKIENAIKLAFTKTSVKEEQRESASLIAYPNPANDKVTLSYTLTSRSKVMVDVYDVLGKKVLTQECGTQMSGKQQLNLDIDGLEKGVYCVRMCAGNSIWQSQFIISE